MKVLSAVSGKARHGVTNDGEAVHHESGGRQHGCVYGIRGRERYSFWRSRLARFTERVFYGIGMMGDDCKKNARWTIRLCSALLPVSYGCGGESEAHGELGLA